ncbi:MAG: hypothetical protein ACYC8T_14375, partial [Myxococcaceae bacterium]
MPVAPGALLVALVACVSCHAPREQGAAAPATPPSPTSSNVTAPFDIGRVIDQVHFAYRKEGEAWTAGHSTYGVRVEGGALEFKPGAAGAPVRFGASVVRRGERLVGDRRGAARTGAQGQLLLERGEVVEALKNSIHGVEQSWHFENRPEAAEALEVQVPVLEGRFVGASPGGLHFQAGEVMVRYGHGTWVDAAGLRTEVPARFEQGAVVLRVPQAVVARSKFPAVLDPIIGPESGMDQPVFGPAFAAQSSPAVAWDGTNHLVVWQDNRNDASGNNSNIFGARVSAAGVVLDPVGIAIALATGIQGNPAVAWSGTNFLVVWADNGTAPANSDIVGTRVSPAGTVQDPSGIAISTAANSQTSPEVAWSGTSFFVVWQDNRTAVGNFDIFGAGVSAAGAVQDPSGIAISTAAGQQSSPALAWSGTNYLVVWRDFRSGTNFDVYGARVSAAGAVQDASGIAISTAANEQSSPAVAWGGTNYLVAWQDNRSGTNLDLYGARVSVAGAVQDLSGIAISTAGNEQSAAAVTWDGTNYLVAWQDTRNGLGKYDIYGARVTSAGAVQDASGIAISTATDDQRAPALAWNGTHYFVVWQDIRSGTGIDVYGARVSAAGAVQNTSGIVISTEANQQFSPDVAWDGTNYLVVWRDYRSGIGPDIYGARVNASGAVQDASGIAISTAANDQLNPAVAWNGANYLVVWDDYRSGTNFDIYGTRVSAAGAVQDPSGIAISTAANGQNNPAVAWGGTSYFVAWQDLRGASLDIYGTRVSAAGAVQDASGIATSTAAGQQRAPAVAWDGTNYLIVWDDTRGGVSTDIYGARVSAAGAVQDASGIAISTAADAQRVAAVAWDGTNHLVVWEDFRSGNEDIYGARVSSAGAVLDGSGIAISAEAGPQQAPVIASRGDHQALVAYKGVDESPGVQTNRVFGRIVTFIEAPVAIPQTVTVA